MAEVLAGARSRMPRSEEHTSELQSLRHLVCRLLLEKKKPPRPRAERHKEFTSRPLPCSPELALHLSLPSIVFFFFNDTATTEIYTLSLHDALPFSVADAHTAQIREALELARTLMRSLPGRPRRSEEHTSELQSLRHLVCRLLLEKKKRPLGADGGGETKRPKPRRAV